MILNPSFYFDRRKLEHVECNSPCTDFIAGKATAEKRKKSKDTRTTAQRKKQKRMRENTDQ